MLGRHDVGREEEVVAAADEKARRRGRGEVARWTRACGCTRFGDRSEF